MKIAVPIAAYEPGTTGEYVARAFRQLGHQVDILSQWQFYTAFRERMYDLYFCVDSGGPLNLLSPETFDGSWEKLAFWMIDYRRGKTLKNPNDRDTCELIARNGGWIFQSQFEDFVSCLDLERVSWLPLAADPDVWSDQPVEEKIYDVGFVGNVWDGTRQQILNDIRRSGLKLGWPGHGAAYMEAGARVLRQSRIGFNVSSFWGEPIAYDVNMRVFETLSCGIPLVTNDVSSLQKLFGGAAFVSGYQSNQIVPFLRSCLDSANGFLETGPEARKWILEFGTYKLRMEQALATLMEKKLW